MSELDPNFKIKMYEQAQYSDDNLNHVFMEGAEWAYFWFEKNVETWIEQIIGSRDKQWEKLVAEKVILEAENAELKAFINEMSIESQDERLSYITCQVDKEIFFKFKQTNEGG